MVDHEQEFGWLLPGVDATGVIETGKAFVVTRLEDGSLATVSLPGRTIGPMPDERVFALRVEGSETLVHELEAARAEMAAVHTMLNVDNLPDIDGQETPVSLVDRVGAVLAERDAAIRDWDIVKEFHEDLVGLWNRACEIAKEHCPAPIGTSHFDVGIPALAARAKALGELVNSYDQQLTAVRVALDAAGVPATRPYTEAERQQYGTDSGAMIPLVQRVETMVKERDGLRDALAIRADQCHRIWPLDIEMECQEFNIKGRGRIVVVPENVARRMRDQYQATPSVGDRVRWQGQVLRVVAIEVASGSSSLGLVLGPIS